MNPVTPGRPFSASTLDDLIDQLQRRLSQWRKLGAAPQYIKDQVQRCWHVMYMPNIDRAQATG